MPSNISPIYTREGDIQGGVLLQNLANDYSGQSANTVPVFTANATNGGFVQRLRFKAANSVSTASVVRIYINEGVLNLTGLGAQPTSVTGVASSTGGSLSNGTFFARVQTVDQYGGFGPISTESSGVTVTSGTGVGSITWQWTASANVQSYRLFVGPVTGGEYTTFNGTAANSYVQTTSNGSAIGTVEDFTYTNMLIGEVSLPIVTASATAATTDIDYPLNIALPPGYRILVGLNSTTGFTGGNGWICTTIGGKY